MTFLALHKLLSSISLADCKVSEVKEFTAEYLEKVLEPSGWQAVWRTNVFEVLLEVNRMQLLSERQCLGIVSN